MNKLYYLIGGLILYKMLSKFPEKISKYITFAEAIKSRTAIKHNIKNLPDKQQLSNMKDTAKYVFEPVRNHYNVPIHVNSFFRSKAVNDKIPFHSNTSQHMTGQAIDISVHNKNISNADLFYYIKNNLEFDQLIWEFGNSKNPQWIHVSYRKGNNRKQVLRSISVKGKKGYIKFNL